MKFNMAKKKDKKGAAFETSTDVDPQNTPEESSPGEASPIDIDVGDASGDGPDVS